MGMTVVELIENEVIAIANDVISREYERKILNKVTSQQRLDAINALP